MRKPGRSTRTGSTTGRPGAWASVRKTSHERVRAEPLVAGQLPLVAAGGLGAGGVGTHVGAALLLGHRHARERAVLVVGRRQPRLPLGRQLLVLAQRGDHGVGHRHRAHHAGAHLAPDVHQRAAHHVRSRLRVASRAASGSRARSPRAAASARRGRARPRRSGGRSGRGCGGSARCARSGRRARSPRASRPARRRRAGAPTPQPPPSRSSASWSGTSASKTLYGASGGAWFSTSWVSLRVVTLMRRRSSLVPAPVLHQDRTARGSRRAPRCGGGRPAGRPAPRPARR